MNNMKINIELSLDKSEDIIIFKITDTVREFVYNYMYSLGTISNINTLCIFMHNGKELNIKKSPNNYLIINENKIEIKTENSYVNQVGEIDIKQLLRDMIFVLYQNDYTKFKVYFMPSDKVLEDHKIKKYNFTEKEIQNEKEKLKKTITKRITITGNDFLTKKKTLKKTNIGNRHQILYLSPKLLMDKKNNLNNVDVISNRFTLNKESFSNGIKKTIDQFKINNSKNVKSNEVHSGVCYNDSNIDYTKNKDLNNFSVKPKEDLDDTTISQKDKRYNDEDMITSNKSLKDALDKYSNIKDRIKIEKDENVAEIKEETEETKEEIKEEKDDILDFENKLNESFSVDYNLLDSNIELKNQLNNEESANQSNIELNSSSDSLSNSNMEPKNELSSEPKNELSSEPKNELSSEPKNELSSEPKNELSSEPKNELSSEPKNDSHELLSQHITGMTSSLTESQYNTISKNWNIEQLTDEEDEKKPGLEKSCMDNLLKSNNSELYTEYF